MITEIRRFNRQGTEAFAHALDQLRESPTNSIPSRLLTDPALTEVIGQRIRLPEENIIRRRWDLALWLYRELNEALPNRDVLRDPGTWSWLAAAMFPIIRPTGSRVFENARYILNTDDYRKRYRHLVAGPYYVLVAHEDEPHIVKAILATPPHAPGDLYEQFAARQELITSPAVMRLITSLYFDEARGELKRGASTSARRLAEVLMQYEVTYDFGTISTTRLASMLPREFDAFRGSPGNNTTTA